MLSKSDKLGVLVGLVSIALVLMMVSCTVSTCNKECQAKREEQRAQESQRPERYYRTEKLFERDGCTVYGFEYRGHSQTFVKCQGDTPRESL